jgi:hypothetical protein
MLFPTVGRLSTRFCRSCAREAALRGCGCCSANQRSRWAGVTDAHVSVDNRYFWSGSVSLSMLG